MTAVAAHDIDLTNIDLGNLDLWRDGPPHELFARMRAIDGLHWSPLDAFPEESGFWSVVRAEDIATVGRDHATFSSKRSIVVVDKLAWDPATPDPMDLVETMLIMAELRGQAAGSRHGRRRPQAGGDGSARAPASGGPHSQPGISRRPAASGH